MDSATRDRLVAFLRPLYQDLDGISHFDEVERIAEIARRLHQPATESETRAFELLLLFHRLGKWLEKVGNLSRAVLATGIPEEDLRQTAAAIRRLTDPVTPEERAVAAAVLIDSAGARGLAERFARARREGLSIADVAREELQDEPSLPQWISSTARDWLLKRRKARAEICGRLLAEIELDDLS